MGSVPHGWGCVLGASASPVAAAATAPVRATAGDLLAAGLGASAEVLSSLGGVGGAGTCKVPCGRLVAVGRALAVGWVVLKASSAALSRGSALAVGLAV